MTHRSRSFVEKFVAPKMSNFFASLDTGLTKQTELVSILVRHFSPSTSSSSLSSSLSSSSSTSRNQINLDRVPGQKCRHFRAPLRPGTTTTIEIWICPIQTLFSSLVTHFLRRFKNKPISSSLIRFLDHSRLL